MVDNRHAKRSGRTGKHVCLKPLRAAPSPDNSELDRSELMQFLTIPIAATTSGTLTQVRFPMYNAILFPVYV